jgi:predicted O-linked N-acetylglucosamine transferase (SPINDLY family)
MGVPVVTLAGQTAISRGGLSILSQIGLTGLAAHSPAQYVEVATSLARDITRLATLRADLRERMRKSPLMDAPAFARDFESILRTAWGRWCATHPC